MHRLLTFVYHLQSLVDTKTISWRIPTRTSINRRCQTKLRKPQESNATLYHVCEIHHCSAIKKVGKEIKRTVIKLQRRSKQAKRRRKHEPLAVQNRSYSSTIANKADSVLLTNEALCLYHAGVISLLPPNLLLYSMGVYQLTRIGIWS